MTLSNVFKIKKSHNQSGNVAIELTFIITIIVFIFSFSLQLGRQFYWQQHFNHAADRLSKLLVLDIQAARKVDQASFNESLNIVQGHLQNQNFILGLAINIISDDITKEESFTMGNGCKAENKFITKMEQLTAVESVEAVRRNAIPTRYLLGLRLCAQPKKWIEILPFDNLGKLPLISHSYYPINHKSLQ